MTARDYPPFRPEWDGMTRREMADALAAIPAPEHDDPVTPRHLTPAEQRAKYLDINDPWEECLIRGVCIDCGARSRHAGTCRYRGGPGYTQLAGGAA